MQFNDEWYQWLLWFDDQFELLLVRYLRKRNLRLSKIRILLDKHGVMKEWANFDLGHLVTSWWAIKDQRKRSVPTRDKMEQPLICWQWHHKNISLKCKRARIEFAISEWDLQRDSGPFQASLVYTQKKALKKWQKQPPLSLQYCLIAYKIDASV